MISVGFLWTKVSGCSKLRWIGRQPVGSAVEQILKNVDLASIQDERARECVRLLLNLIESLSAELRKAQAENQYLREQLKRRQEGGGKSSSSPATSAQGSRSLERERAEPSEKKPHTKCSKLDRIPCGQNIQMR
jgi:hypothetical protein